MSYLTSAQAGRIRELYLFNSDEGSTRYTSGAYDVTAMTEVWTALPIDRTEPEQGAEVARANIKLTFPRTDAFALELIDPYGIDHRISLTIWSEDDDDDWAVFWKGRVTGASMNGNEIVIDCESILTSSNRMGLPSRVTRTCGHAVYHRGCNLDRTLWEVVTTATAIDGNVITVTAASGQPDGWYLGGMIEYDGVLRWIVGHAGTDITILRPFRGLAEDIALGSVAVKIYPGCDRTKETCNDKFDNLLNRLGFDWIPERSPFDGSSVL